MNENGSKKDTQSKDLINAFKKTSSLCKTDLEEIGINIDVKHTIHIVGGHTDTVHSVCFSPNGNLLATGSGDHTARLWDVATGRCVHVLGGHTSIVDSVCFSPNGKLLATGSDDHTIRFWDVTSGAHLVTFYNLNQGFLWTTPPDDVAKSGWFGTDRPELIHALACDKKGGEVEAMADDNSDRDNYIKNYNRQDIVMWRLNDFVKYQAEIESIKNANQIKKIDRGLQRQPEALPGLNSGQKMHKHRRAF